MDKATIQRLNAINREFYRVTADEFDQTRGSAWEGWKTLLPYLHTPLSVLDVGCGNGRFGLFLRESLGDGVHYHGMDNNRRLLDYAKTALTGMDAHLEERDIVENPPDAGEYDLVVLFGVLHHIPGYSERQILMRRLAERVKLGGLLVFACWRFYAYERFRQRITPWPGDIQVEPGDYLLDWRRGAVALRYCHHVDDAELDAIITATTLEDVTHYRADGQDGQANQYVILRKK